MPEAVLTNPFAAADERATTSTRILVSLRILFSHVLEMFGMVGYENLRLMLVVTSTALLVVFITGNIIRAVKTETGARCCCINHVDGDRDAIQLARIRNSQSVSEQLAEVAHGFHHCSGSDFDDSDVSPIAEIDGMGSGGFFDLGNSGRIGGGDRLVGIGTLSNPNEVAFHLWLGMPFLIYLITQSRAVKKIILIGICGFELLMIIKTVSREGLLLAGAIALLTCCAFQWATR